MSLSTNFCITLSFLSIVITCIILSSDNYAQASENEAESITKIGQGVGHIMNIYYW